MNIVNALAAYQWSPLVLRLRVSGADVYLRMRPMLVSASRMKSSWGDRAMPLGMYRESSSTATPPVSGS